MDETPLYIFWRWLSLLESEFQSRLIKEIKDRFPGVIVLKNDSSYCQGIPDLIILWRDRWAALECKKDRFARCRPNQQYYVDEMNEMAFAAIIYPENKEDILFELEYYFRGCL